MAGSPRSVACGRQASGGPYENLRRPRAYGQNRRRTGQRIGPCDDLKPTVLMFGKRGATLHPVTAVHIADAVLAANRGVMDMAADHAVGAVTPRLAGERLLERADVIHRVLHLELRP